MYRAIDCCRLCGDSRLEPLIDLGLHALTGVFPREKHAALTKGPLELVKCAGACGLVQLRHSYELAELYGRNYGYRSSLNRSMVEHLQRRVAKVLEIASPSPGDLVLDIGSNDGTLLRSYPDRGLALVGIDPTAAKFREFYPPNVTVIPHFFSAERFRGALGARKPKVVTSIAMFYDLEAPLEFAREIEQILADDGVWVFEQSYTPTMLAMTAYDTICHEHLEYYCLKQIKWITDRAGLKIVDVELNDVNGGSFAVTVAKARAPIPEATARIAALLAEEERRGLDSLETFHAFKERVFRHRDRLREFIAATKEAGRTILGYGASTKGNVILQFCGLTEWDLPCMAEVNRDKFGCFTPGTGIPIVSEEEARARNPDFFLVMPWHFRAGIVQRESAFLQKGKHLIFPLPELEVVGVEGSRAVS
jgi:NDP-4-keto-2,6-dideoxyhexose 3-C-methyltransferase